MQCSISPASIHCVLKAALKWLRTHAMPKCPWGLKGPQGPEGLFVFTSAMVRFFYSICVSSAKFACKSRALKCVLFHCSLFLTWNLQCKLVLLPTHHLAERSESTSTSLCTPLTPLQQHLIWFYCSRVRFNLMGIASPRTEQYSHILGHLLWAAQCPWGLTLLWPFPPQCFFHGCWWGWPGSQGLPSLLFLDRKK